MTENKLLLPGKLLNPNQILENDSRLDYRLKKLIIEQNLGEQNNNEIKVSPSSSLKEKYENIAEQEPNVEKMMANLFEDVELLENIDEDKISIIGEDKNEIDIYISKPKFYNSSLPCILHIHGGGMGLMGADTICYKIWRIVFFILIKNDKLFTMPKHLRRIHFSPIWFSFWGNFINCIY